MVMKRIEFLKSLIVAPVAISQIDLSVKNHIVTVINQHAPITILFPEVSKYFTKDVKKIFIGCKTDFPLTKVKSL